jgi:hypothetical protein
MPPANPDQERLRRSATRDCQQRMEISVEFALIGQGQRKHHPVLR